jgi:hypothetical protein
MSEEKQQVVEVKVCPWIEEGTLRIDIRIGDQEMPTMDVSLDDLVTEYVTYRLAKGTGHISSEYFQETHELVAQLRELSNTIEASCDGLKRYYQ